MRWPSTTPDSFATSLVKQNGHIFFRATDSSTGNQAGINSTGTINVDGANVTAADVTLQGSQVTVGGTVNTGSGSVAVTTTSGNGQTTTSRLTSAVKPPSPPVECRCILERMAREAFHLAAA